MTLAAGNILEGTVVNITNFGAFVEVDGKTGLVHISEVADSFVKDIRQHLNEQDKVKVKVISIDDNGKISLSIKQANVQKKSVKPVEYDWGTDRNTNNNTSNNKIGSVNFEDKISKFLKDSEEKMQDVKKHQEFKGKNSKSRS
jgi:S1 RNA binding domain protein